MPQDNPYRSPWDIRTQIRVSDRNNVFASSAELGRAVGWAKMKAASLNAQLLSVSEDGTLPFRTYRFAMPVSGISMIEIESDPPRGMWRIRIVGGGEVAGNFIWVPVDLETVFPVGSSLGQEGDFIGRRNNILVRSAAKDGPYAAQEQDLEAGNIDWKGPLRTTKADGTPLDPPLTDVLTIMGAENRYGPGLGSRTHTHFVWKNGAKYARAPFFPLAASTPNPETDIGQDLTRLRGVVLGCAIQRNAAGEARDVMVTDTVEPPAGGGNPPLELFTVQWHTWWRPAGASLLTNGIFQDINPATGSGDPPDSLKWRLIASFPGPVDFNGQRYTRHRTWFFNRSGTQACCMVPGNQVGDYTPSPSAFPGTGTVPAFNLQQVNADQFPNYFRQAVITIDAFAETASIAISGRSAAGITKTIDVQPANCAGGGSTTQGCPPPPEFRDFPPPVGSFSISRSQSSSNSYSGGNKWQVACDFKGDTLVPAFLEFSGGQSASSSLSVTQPSPGEASGTFSSSLNADVRYTLSFGSVSEVVAQVTNTDTTTNSSASRITTTVASAANKPDQIGAGVAIMWMDIRTDLLLISISHSMTQTRTGSGGELLRGGFSTLGLSSTYRIAYDTSSGVEEHNSSIRLIQGGGVLTEWAWDTTRTIGGIPSLSGIFGVGFFVDTVFGICPPNGTATLFRTDTSRDSFCVQPTVALGGTVTFDINGPPSLESFGLTPGVGFTFFGDRRAQMNPYQNASIQTDTAGNIAMSTTTFELAAWSDDRVPGKAVRDNVAWTSVPLPRVEPYLNFLSGDNFVDVSNQVVFTDPGIDPDDPLDDVDLPPIATVSGHADPSTGPVLQAERDAGLGGGTRRSIAVL